MVRSFTCWLWVGWVCESSIATSALSQLPEGAGLASLGMLGNGFSVNWAVLPEFCFRSQIQNCEELLTDQMVVVLFRGIFRGWRNVLVRNLLKLGKGWAESYPWAGAASGTGTGWGMTVCKASGQKRLWGSCWTPGWPWASDVPLWQRWSPASWALLGRALPAGWGTWWLFCAQPLWDKWRGCVQLQVTKYKRDVGHTGVSPAKGHKED